jgi:putative phosphoribosyl transferase
MSFADRTDAGRRLAAHLRHLRDDDVVVLGLPRGGVPVAFPVALALDAPLDVIVVRKLGLPHQSELAMGAIGEGGVRVVDRSLVARAQVTDYELAEVERRERAELDRRADRFRAGRERTPVAGRTVVVVDDGVATGATARAACQVARAEGATRVVLAVPVGATATVDELRSVADEVVCPEVHDVFYAIGQFYADFSQTSDEEVVDLLRRAHQRTAAEPARPTGGDPADSSPGLPARDDEVEVRAGAVSLAGRLTIPQAPEGIVVFAHGSGSSRHSPRNRFVAGVLNEAGLATLLLDLLVPTEEHDRANVFDIGLLADRLVDVTGWLRSQPGTAPLPVGYFGASTGAAAALVAAAEPAADVAAVVSRGGRPDLAGRRLAQVHVPTLLIVGGNDPVVLGLNREAQAQLGGDSRLVVVPGATHLFEEPGALPAVADLARAWFGEHLAVSRSSPA